MSDDLPTMDAVLASATARYSPDVLDRALAEHDRQVTAQTLRDAADELLPGEVRTWLRDRADSAAPRPATPALTVSAEQVEWGVRLDDLGSTDLYETEAAARAALADGGVLVRITTTEVTMTEDGEGQG